MSSNVASIRGCLLIDGYIRNQYCKHEAYDKFEKSLVMIIVKLLGNIFMIFDVYPVECKSSISKDGLKFKPDQKMHKDVTFGCSYGWNDGINKVSIRNKYKWQGHAIGITNNIQQFSEEAIWYGFVDKDEGLYYNLNSGSLVGSQKLLPNSIYLKKCKRMMV